jgi:hypothetical protein
LLKTGVGDASLLAFSKLKVVRFHGPNEVKKFYFNSVQTESSTVRFQGGEKDGWLLRC